MGLILSGILVYVFCFVAVLKILGALYRRIATDELGKGGDYLYGEEMNIRKKKSDDFMYRRYDSNTDPISIWRDSDMEMN
tara:strand:- start:115479 stop:115718 length:240 start_codon:yes stop_codon:yes gene_type:complete